MTRSMAAISVLVLSACAGSNGQAAADRPRAPADRRSEPDPRACSIPSECGLIWTRDDPCGLCGVPRRGHVEALNQAGRLARHVETGGCPACEEPDDPTLTATCAGRRCAVVDLLESPLTRCDSSADCAVVRTIGLCENRLFVAVHRGDEAALTALQGAPPECLGALPAVAASCTAGHCTLPPGSIGRDTLPAEPTPTDSIGATGTLEGCTITLGTGIYWRSWTGLGGADDLEPMRIRVEAQIRCGSTPPALTASGWLVSAGGHRLVHFSRAIIANTERTPPLTPPADVIFDASIIADDGPPLPPGTEVHAVIRWTTPTGFSLTLSAPTGPVRHVS